MNHDSRSDHDRPPPPCRRGDGGTALRGSGRVLTAFLLATLVGCASSSDTSSAGGGTIARGDARVITQEDMLGLGVSSAYEVVERLHPIWLISGGTRTRSTRLPSEIVVVANEQYFGPPASLRQIPVGGILEIRYIPGADAVNRYPQLANGRFVEAAIVVRQVATQR